MSFTYRDGRQASAAGAASLTIVKPSLLAVGDLMVAFIGKDDDPAITPPSGWTEIRGGTGTTTGNDQSWWFGYKVADASDVAASNFVWNGDTGEDWAGILGAFTPSNSNPVHEQTSAATLRSDDTTPISAAISTATSGNLLLGAAVASQCNPEMGMVTSGYTLVAGYAPYTGSGNGDVGALLAYKLSAAGTETTFEVNNVESTGESHVFLMEFSDDSAGSALVKVDGETEQVGESNLTFRALVRLDADTEQTAESDLHFRGRIKIEAD